MTRRCRARERRAVGIALHAQFLVAPALTSSSAASSACSRRVYLDLGANWANTLHLADELERHMRNTTRTVLNQGCTHQWEVYAFEASPVMYPFVDAYVEFLNARGPRPNMTVPPVGSSIAMMPCAKRMGCPSSGRSEYKEMFECMDQLFLRAYAALAVNPMFNDMTLVQRRLDEASEPNTGTAVRYTFVPAAVGSAVKSLDLMWQNGQMGVMTASHIQRPIGVPEKASVPVIDLVSWMKKHFRQSDLVIAKMDVEGAEHAILNRMMDDDSINLIDVLGLECHGKGCQQLNKGLHDHGQRVVPEQRLIKYSSAFDKKFCEHLIRPDDAPAVGNQHKHGGLHGGRAARIGLMPLSHQQQQQQP